MILRGGMNYQLCHSTSLVPRLSWEGKESLVTTARACAKISVFYPHAIRGLLDHVTVYTMPAKLESC